MTRLDLLEKVNSLNTRGHAGGVMYWTVPVMYNTVIYRRDPNGDVSMVEVIDGVLR